MAHKIKEDNMRGFFQVAIVIQSHTYMSLIIWFSGPSPLAKKLPGSKPHFTNEY